MLLSSRPSEITTHEQNILWSFSQLKTKLAASSASTAYPLQITEAQGYYPSEIVSVQEIASVDGGPRHVLRILMPVSPEYYGSPIPVWRFAKSIAGGGGIGMDGFLIPGSTDRFRFNPVAANGSLEKLAGGTTTWSNIGGSNELLSIHYGLDGTFYTAGRDGKNYSVSTSSLAFTLITAAAYAAAIASPQGPIGL